MLIRACVIAAAASLVFAQSSAGPAFEAGDIRVSPRAANFGMRGGYYPADNRYELHQATMADLIRTAWNLDDNNRVIGGPAWLDDVRFDVLAKAPAGTSRDDAKLMLRSLLAERAGLAVHEEKMPIPAYVLIPGKRMPQLKDAAGQGECQKQPSEPGAAPTQAIACHAITMEAFARALPGFASDYFGHLPMVDQTGLRGSWDFALKWNTRNQLAAAGSDGVSLFDAIDRQLGLRLEQQDAPLPVIVVDRVNEKPIESSPETMRKLPRTPTEFEVGAIRPSAPDEKPYERILPNGEVDLRAAALKELILYAWDIAGAEGLNDELLIAPKWIETARFDVIAKAVAEKPTDAPPLDEGALRVMMRNLLLSRFRMAVHYEERPVTAYSMTAAKPKFTRSDPSVRTSCKIAALPAGSRSPLTRNFLCQNVTMSRFAEKLRDIATDWVDHPVVDETGLAGGWTFTISFSPRAAMASGAGASSDVVDPDGKLSLFEALNKELGLKLEIKKAPMRVLVIDRLEQQPIDN